MFLTCRATTHRTFLPHIQPTAASILNISLGKKVERTEGNCAILLQEEVWVQCSSGGDLLMLNSDPDLNTHKFTVNLCGELSKMLSTQMSPETHIYHSQDELLKTHHPTMSLTRVSIGGCCLVQGACWIRAQVVCAPATSLFVISALLDQLLSPDTPLSSCRLLSKWCSSCSAQVQRGFFVSIYWWVTQFL